VVVQLLNDLPGTVLSRKHATTPPQRLGLESRVFKRLSFAEFPVSLNFSKYKSDIVYLNLLELEILVTYLLRNFLVMIIEAVISRVIYTRCFSSKQIIKERETFL